MKMSKGRIGRQLLGFAVAGMALAAFGTASAEMGQPAPWEVTLQEAASPVMENIVWFHNFLLVLITVITLFVLALLVIVVVKVQRPRQPGPVPDHAQHADRGGLDADSGSDPGRHRGAVVPAVVSATRRAEIRPDHQGRPASSGTGATPIPITASSSSTRCWTRTSSRGCSASTTKWSCRSTRCADPDHRRRRDPLFRGAVLRHQDRFDPRPAQRDLVQGHQDRDVLRPVLGIVRQGSRLHADRGASGERPGIRELGRCREEEICDQPGEFVRFDWARRRSKAAYSHGRRREQG